MADLGSRLTRMGLDPPAQIPEFVWPLIERLIGQVDALQTSKDRTVSDLAETRRELAIKEPLLKQATRKTAHIRDEMRESETRRLEVEEVVQRKTTQIKRLQAQLSTARDELSKARHQFSADLRDAQKRTDALSAETYRHMGQPREMMLPDIPTPLVLVNGSDPLPKLRTDAGAKLRSLHGRVVACAQQLLESLEVEHLPEDLDLDPLEALDLGINQLQQNLVTQKAQSAAKIRDMQLAMDSMVDETDEATVRWKHAWDVAQRWKDFILVRDPALAKELR